MEDSNKIEIRFAWPCYCCLKNNRVETEEPCNCCQHNINSDVYAPDFGDKFEPIMDPK